MNGVQKKTTVRSTTLFGLSVVVVMFDDGVDNNFARIQVNNALMGVELPDGVELKYNRLMHQRAKSSAIPLKVKE
jgi:cobalt-zinc-cadmium resistance protein CzcA